MPKIAIAVCALAVVLVLAWRVLMPSADAPAPPSASQPTGQEQGASSRAVEVPRADGADATATPDVQPDGTRSEVLRDTRAVIRGRCVDEQGAALAGVSVKLEGINATSERLAQYRMQHGEPQWQDPAAIASDAEGRFELRFEPPPPHAFRVTLMPSSRAWVEQLWWNLDPGSTTDMGDVVLPLGVTVAGRIVDVEGAAVANQHVALRLRSTRPRGDPRTPELITYGSARSDAGGGFALDRPLPAGTYILDVQQRRVREPAGDIELVPPDAQLRVVVETPVDVSAEAITGVVVDARGLPIPGAGILADDSEWSWANARRNGAFVLAKHEQLDKDRVKLGASAAGYATWRSDEPVAWGTRDVRIVLGDGSPLTIRVLESDDATPIERFGIRRVPLRPQDGRSPDDYKVLHAGVHPGGELALERVTPGRYLLSVVPAADLGLPPSAEREIVLEPGIPAVVEFRLAPLAERVVEVVDRAGVALPGLRVELLLPPRGGPLHLATPALSPESLQMNSVRDNACLCADPTTDAEGRVTLRGHGELDHALRLPGPGNVPLLVQPFRLDGDGIARVVVGTGATLRGRIEPAELIATLRAEAQLPPTGPVPADSERELPGLQLQSSDPRTGGVFPMGGILGGDVPPDEDGRFVLVGIPPGTWQIHLRSSWRDPGLSGGRGGRAIPGSITLAEGENREIVLDLRTWLRRSVTLSVRVDGRPHEGQVRLEGRFGPGPMEREYRGVACAADGTAEVMLPEGEWSIQVDANLEGRSVALPGPRFIVGGDVAPLRVLVELWMGRRTVLVLDPDGTAVAGCRLVTIDVARDLRDWGSTTDAGGRVTLLGSPGSRRVEARREPLTDDRVYSAWTQERREDRDARRRAFVELGTVELLSEPGEPLTLRLPPEWREMPK